MYFAKDKNERGLTRDFLLFKLSKVKRIIKAFVKMNFDSFTNYQEDNFITNYLLHNAKFPNPYYT